MCRCVYIHIDECIDIYTHTHKDMLTQIHIQTKLNHIACLKMTRETTFKTKHWLQLISSLSVLLGKQVMEMLWCLGFRAFLVSFRVVFFFFFSTFSDHGSRMSFWKTIVNLSLCLFITEEAEEGNSLCFLCVFLMKRLLIL